MNDNPTFIPPPAEKKIAIVLSLECAHTLYLAIKFLKEVCEDNPPPGASPEIQKMLRDDVEALFKEIEANSFHAFISPMGIN